MTPNLCRCGCGKPVPPDKRGRINNFIPSCWKTVKHSYLSTKAKSPQRLAASIKRITQVNIDVKNGIRKPGHWIDGKLRSRDDGYIMVKQHGHPRANQVGYVFEHILIMEQCIGRHLTKDEVVHHVNRLRTDNRIENLFLLPSISAHMRLHAEEDKRRDALGRFSSFQMGDSYEIHQNQKRI